MRRRVVCRRGQLFQGHQAIGITKDFQRPQHGSLFARLLVWHTALAGAQACGLCIKGRSVEPHIFTLRRPRWAAGTTIDSGGMHAGHKHAVKAPVLGQRDAPEIIIRVSFVGHAANLPPAAKLCVPKLAVNV